MKRRTTPDRSRRDRGVVLLYALIALVLMLIAAVALVRSFDTGLFNAGNSAFRRDLVNQGERIEPVVLALFKTGTLQTDANRTAHHPEINYSATQLATNEQGIPLVLLSDAAFTAAGLAPSNDIQIAAQKVSIRYVIDRQCQATGTATLANCEVAEDATNQEARGGALSDDDLKLPTTLPITYRVSVRVDGPRSTRVFLQSTISW